jgi:GLPGLI family protein
MKNLTIKLVVFVAVIFTSIVQAQNFQGRATYMSKTMMNSLTFDSPNMTEEMKKNLQESLKKALEKNYVLTFNKTESIYQEEHKLESPEPANGARMMIESFDYGKNYKNIKDKIEIVEEDFLGKEFLINDSLKKWDWKLESETKKIGDFLCSKATCIEPISKEDKKEYEDYLKRKESGKTQLFSMEEPKDKVITVWYTSEIPISQGPHNYWGLPGLILEVNDGETVLLCSGVVLNPKEKIEIKVPTKGKKVNKKTYDKIVSEQLESMKDSNGAIRIDIGR